MRLAVATISPRVPASQGLPLPVVACLFLPADWRGLGGEFGPGDQVRGGGEHVHIDAEFGDEVLGGGGADAGDLVETGDLGGVGGDGVLDGVGQLVDSGGEVVDAFEHHLADQRVVVVEVPVQGLLQLADLPTHAGAGHLSKDLRVTLAGDHRFQHGPAGNTEDVAGHGGQFDLGVFEQLLQTLLLPGPVAHQGAPVAGQIPQPADRLGWHEAGPAHAPLNDLGQPDCVEPPRVRWRLPTLRRWESCQHRRGTRTRSVRGPCGWCSRSGSRPASSRGRSPG